MSRIRIALLVVAFLLLGILASSIVIALVKPWGSPRKEDLSRVLADAQADRIAWIVVSGNNLAVHLRDGHSYESRKQSGTSIVTILANNGVDPGQILVEGEHVPAWTDYVVRVLSILILVGLLILIGMSIWKRVRPPSPVSK